MKNDISKYQPAFSLVLGYLPNIEGKRSRNKFKNLNKKFSLILETYNPEKGEMYFDFKMFLDLLKPVLENPPFEEIEITEKNKKKSFSDIDDFMEYLKMIVYNNETNELDFSQIIITEKSQPTLLLIPEYYNSIGGPMPYHDSITYTFFYEKIEINEIIKQLRIVSHSNNYKIRSLKTGLEKPKVSVFQKIKNFLY